MIKTTLYVGLGTTGTDILIELRRLIFEEFGEPGLPIIRMVAIETNNTKTTEDRNVTVDRQKPYHNIDMISVGIPETGPIKSMLDPQSPTYHPGLQEWLNPVILDDMDFRNGAGHIRMAGRLCLWNSWALVEQKLDQAVGAILSPAARQVTSAILANYFNKNRIPPPANFIDTTPDVYVLGTFCGGTCSGMFFDIAYLLKNIMKRQGLKPAVSGVFSILDQTMVSKPQFLKDAVNCYTALQEMDYFHNPNNRRNPYKISPIKNGLPIEDARQPFDRVYIVSTSGGQQGTNPVIIVREDGERNPEPLNFMIALNLFMDIGQKTRNAKAAAWAGIIGSPQFNSIPHNGVGYCQFISTFGLSALWYPKYRIVNAVAASLSRDILVDWLGSSSSLDQKSIKVSVDTFFQEHFIGDNGFLNKISSKLSIEQNALVALELADLEEKLQRDFPNNQSCFLKEMEHDGRVSKNFDQFLPSNAQSAYGKLEDFYTNQINALGANYSCLDAIKKCFENLDTEFERIISELPTSLPDTVILSHCEELKSIRLEILNVQNNRWLQLAGTTGEIISELKKSYLERFKKILNNQYESIRGYYLRYILLDLRRALGNKTDLGAPENIRIERTYFQRLYDLTSLIEISKNNINNYYRQIIQISTSPSIKVVGSIDQTEINLTKQLKTSLLGDRFLATTLKEILTFSRNNTLSELFNMEPSDFENAFLDFFRDRVKLATLDRVDPINLAQNENSDLMQLLTNQSQPMLQIQPHSHSLTARSPDFIAGPNQNTIQSLLFQLRITNLNIQDSDFTNFVVTYREKGPLSLDQLSVYDSLKSLHDQYSSRYPNHTHIKGFPNPLPPDPDFYRWLKIAITFNDKLDIFKKLEGGTFCYDYRNQQGITVKFIPKFDSPSFDKFVQIKQNRNQFVYKVKALCQRFGEAEFTDMINGYLTTLYPDPTVEEYDQETNFFSSITKELFSDGKQGT